MKLDPLLEKDLMSMDDASEQHIQELSEVANWYIHDKRALIEQYIKCLYDSKESGMPESCKNITTEKTADYSYEVY